MLTAMSFAGFGLVCPKGSSLMLDRKTYQGDFLSTYEFAKNYISLYTQTALLKKAMEQEMR